MDFFHKSVKHKGVCFDGLFFDASSSSIIVIFPGLFGDIHNSLFCDAGVFFQRKGYDVYIVDFYKNGSQRKFGLTSFKKITKDIAVLLEFFSQKYKNNYIFAHSMGSIYAYMLPYSKLNIKGVVLWDPSLHPKDIFSRKFSRKLGDYYVFSWEFLFVIHKKIMMEFALIPPLYDLQLKNNVPLVCIVFANKGGFRNVKDLYIKTPNTKYFVIDDDHLFSHPKQRGVLYKKTFDSITNLLQ